MNLLIGNKTVLRRTLEHFEHICNRIVVVGGYRIDLIQEQMKKIRLDNTTIEVVYNERFDEGMFSSVQKGCRALKEDTFFLTPGDFPLIKKSTIHALAMCPDEVVRPRYQNHNGHPIKLGSKVKQAIIHGDEKDNLRNILHKFNKTTIDVDDPGILMDLDTPDDYIRINKRIHHFNSRDI